MIDETLHDGDEAGIGGRHLMAFEHVERHARVEIAHRQVGAADIENGEHRQHRGDVEHGQRRPEAIFVGEAVAMASERDGVADLRLMGDEAALGIRGGPGGVEHEAHIAYTDAEARDVHRALG
jgi:hypothetical protein